MAVSSDKMAALLRRMAELGIYEEDLEEKFIRSSGPGGQNVNKTSTAVQLLHVPTGLMVKVQRERFREMNRYWARRILADKIEEKLTGQVAEKKYQSEKIRRQKRRRSRRSKEKMLANKHHTAEKKKTRTKPTRED